MPYTAAQLVTEACQIAKCPGYTAQAGRNLNLTLTDLVMHRNLKVNLVTSSINIAINSYGPFNLEANYKRTYDFFYLVQGVPYFLEPASLREFDEEVQLTGLSNYPSEFATDLSPVANGGVGLLYVYPQTSNPIVATHRYYLAQPEIPNAESSSAIPWFEDQDYLLTALAARLMRITDDDRYEKWLQDSEMLLKKHLLMEGDEQQVVKEVRLDPRRFTVRGSSRPTKLDPF